MRAYQPRPEGASKRRGQYQLSIPSRSTPTGRIGTASGRTRRRWRTKREANQTAIELEQRALRQRVGLERLRPQDDGGIVCDLMTWWRETFSEGSAAHTKNLSTIERHLFEGKIADARLAELTKGRLRRSSTRRPGKASRRRR